MSDRMVKLRVGGEVFEVEKESLLRFDHTFFHGLFSSGAWQPDADGAYFIDRPAMGFDRILEYLSSGKLSVEGLSDLEEDCIYSSLDYLLIPYRRQWKYDTQIVIEGFRASSVCELKEGRLCCAYFYDIIVWNMHTSDIETTLRREHTELINQVIQLHDGRVCSCSFDDTIKLWSTDSGLSELTLTGHTNIVYCMMQLFDGRLCSGAEDRTIRVWNVFSGVCEMTMNAQNRAYSMVQLADGRICCGDYDGTISIYSLLTGECERSWKGHPSLADISIHTSIVRIDGSRICSCRGGTTIMVWNTATGECERILEGHYIGVTSMVLMQDGRLCSASADGILIILNLETGEREKTLGSTSDSRINHKVMQLSDGRLVSSFNNDHRNVCLWS